MHLLSLTHSMWLCVSIVNTTFYRLFTDFNNLYLLNLILNLICNIKLS